jgi:hypothetical protein
LDADRDRIAEILEGLAALKAAMARVEASLETGPPQPAPDPSAVEAAQKMVERRRMQILKDAGIENGDDPDYEG